MTARLYGFWVLLSVILALVFEFLTTRTAHANPCALVATLVNSPRC
jgi:hypothetical protein